MKKKITDEQIAAHILDGGDVEKMRRRHKENEKKYNSLVKKLGYKKVAEMQEKAWNSMKEEIGINRDREK